MDAYDVEGCLITDNGKQCDYLVLVRNGTKALNAYFIELKGSDLKGAIAQLKRSVEIISIQEQGFNVFGRVVTTKTSAPAINSIDYKRLQRTLNDLGGDLKAQTRQLKDTM